MLDRKQLSETIFIRLKGSAVSDTSFSLVRYLLDETAREIDTNPKGQDVVGGKIKEKLSYRFFEEPFDPDNISSIEKLKEICLDREHRRCQICIVMNAADLVGPPSRQYNGIFGIKNPGRSYQESSALSNFIRMKELFHESDDIFSARSKLFLLGQKALTEGQFIYLLSALTQHHFSPNDVYCLSMNNASLDIESNTNNKQAITEEDTQLITKFFANFMMLYGNSDHDTSFPANAYRIEQRIPGKTS